MELEFLLPVFPVEMTAEAVWHGGGSLLGEAALCAGPLQATRAARCACALALALRCPLTPLPAAHLRNIPSSSLQRLCSLSSAACLTSVDLPLRPVLPPQGEAAHSRLMLTVYPLSTVCPRVRVPPVSAGRRWRSPRRSLRGPRGADTRTSGHAQGADRAPSTIQMNFVIKSTSHLRSFRRC